MSDLDNREKAIELYDCYGMLLTKTQQEFFSSYYLFDLSLSEIAEEKKISRSAVNDALSKALKKLNEYESKLHLLEKNKSIREILDSFGKYTSLTTGTSMWPLLHNQKDKNGKNFLLNKNSLMNSYCSKKLLVVW